MFINIQISSINIGDWKLSPDGISFSRASERVSLPISGWVLIYLPLNWLTHAAYPLISHEVRICTWWLWREIPDLRYYTPDYTCSGVTLISKVTLLSISLTHIHIGGNPRWTFLRINFPDWNCIQSGHQVFTGVNRILQKNVTRNKKAVNGGKKAKVQTVLSSRIFFVL